MRKAFLDPTGCLDEVDGVVVMFRDSGGDRQNVRVEDDVLGREMHLIDEDAVGTFADSDLVQVCCRLSLLIKGHHHYGGSVTADYMGLLPEALLSLLE